jgi:putative redox protein
VTGEISKQAPIEYTAMHIVYEFKGDEESKQAALDAVMASQEKYCGISHMLKKILPITWDVSYNEYLIFTNKKETILS